MASYKIYEKSERFVFTRNRISLFLFLFCLLSLTINLRTLRNDLLSSIFGWGTIFFMIVHLVNTLFKEELKGKLEGLLTLRMNEIQIKDRVIKLEEIMQVSFEINDFEGRQISTQIGYREMFSRGVQNKLLIYLYDEKPIICYFQLKFQNEIMKSFEEIYHYKELGILSKDNYHEITS